MHETILRHRRSRPETGRVVGGRHQTRGCHHASPDEPDLATTCLHNADRHAIQARTSVKLEAAVGQEATRPKQVVIALCALAVACRVALSVVA